LSSNCHSAITHACHAAATAQRMVMEKDELQKVLNVLAVDEYYRQQQEHEEELEEEERLKLDEEERLKRLEEEEETQCSYGSTSASDDSFSNHHAAPRRKFDKLTTAVKIVSGVFVIGYAAYIKIQEFRRSH